MLLDVTSLQARYKVYVYGAGEDDKIATLSDNHRPSKKGQ